MKEGPWAAHITLCSDKGAGRIFVTSLHFTTKKRPCLHYHNLQQDIARGVATLGHTGVRTLATRGSAPPVQVSMRIIGRVVDRESGAKRS